MPLILCERCDWSHVVHRDVSVEVYCQMIKQWVREPASITRCSNYAPFAGLAFKLPAQRVTDWALDIDVRKEPGQVL